MGARPLEGRAPTGRPRRKHFTTPRHKRRDVFALLDVMMPRLTGIEVTGRIRVAEGPIRTVPILLISARAGESDINEGLAAGADGYLKKPFDTHELHDRLQTILQRRR